MAAGRSGGSGRGGAQWRSTRTRVSVSAHGSPVSAATTTTVSSSSYEYERTSSSTQGSPLGGATGTSSSAVAAELRDEDGDDNDNAAGLSTSNSNPLYGESEDEYVDDDDEDDEWEDLGYNGKPVFRDFKFPEPLGDADDSEYAPSDTEEKHEKGLLLPRVAMSDDDDDDGEDLSASELEDEEEESSVAGLFASVIRQFGGTAKKTREDPNAFTEQDREFWATPEEKQQWVARFNEANQQFLHKYGCRIDSPAHPEAKAKLRREKKKKNVYALILFALCVAYLVQLVAISTNSVLTVQSVVDGVKNSVEAIPYVCQRVLEKLSSMAPKSETDESTGSPSPIGSTTTTSARYESVVDEKAGVTISEAEVAEQVVVVEGVVEVEGVVVRVEKLVVEGEPPVGEATEEPEIRESSADDLAKHFSDRHEEEPATLMPSSEGILNPKDETMPAESPQIEKEEQAAADFARAAVQLCSKLLNRLVKSKYDQTVKDAAVRACSAAVAIAPQDSVDWLEARVLRGDLWSLVSEFDTADSEYNAAATSVATSGSQADQSKVNKLSQEIQMKILANRWINMFTKRNNYKQLRQEVARVSKAADQYSAPIRSLATDWLLVFKKKKQPVEVLTATRLWTLQRLEYA